MANDADIARELGEIGARLNGHDDRLDKIDANVEKLLEYAARMKGGWWALGAVGGIGGAIGAGAVKLFAMLKGGG